MALPCGTTGSLRPAFAPARDVSLAVKPPYAFALDGWFPLSLRGPSRASVTLWEATAPVRFQSLPPILHMLLLGPLQSCSKGAQGLSVLPRVPGIFTESAISLSPWSRQWGNRYAIRAGRNLPDKEFRYLRTVIVTAAVYRGFGSPRRLAANGSP
jgi:hypothetical protein